jgi:hypothetical protein
MANITREKAIAAAPIKAPPKVAKKVCNPENFSGVAKKGATKP